MVGDISNGLTLTVNPKVALDCYVSGTGVDRSDTEWFSLGDAYKQEPMKWQFDQEHSGLSSCERMDGGHHTGYDHLIQEMIIWYGHENNNRRTVLPDAIERSCCRQSDRAKLSKEKELCCMFCVSCYICMFHNFTVSFLSQIGLDPIRIQVHQDFRNAQIRDDILEVDEHSGRDTG